MGTFKGVRRVYQQSFIDTYSKAAFAKLYLMKTPTCTRSTRDDVPGKECHFGMCDRESGGAIIRLQDDHHQFQLGLADAAE